MASDKLKKNQVHQKLVAKKRKQAQHRAAVTLHQLVKDIDDHPHNYHTYYDLGTFLVELHSYTQAEELFMKALGLFAKQNSQARDTLLYGLGNVYYSVAEYNKAIKIFAKIKDRKLKVDSYIMLAQSYMSKKDYKRAIVFALTARGFLKQNPVINGLLGANLLALGDFKSSARFYDVALRAEPKNGKFNFNRGIAAVVLGQPFRNYFRKAKRYNPKYYQKGQKRLAEIERFVIVNRKKRK